MQNINKIISLLKKHRGFDFSGYRHSMVERRIQKRLKNTGIEDYDEYLEYLKQHPSEFDHLVDVLTINVSHFFRNYLTFGYIDKIILPELVQTKINTKDKSLRIWSAGCSFGEEPYTVAMLLNEFLEKEEATIQTTIFATDIDEKALLYAKAGSYGINKFEEIKFGLVNKYFTKEGDKFTIDPEIKKKVHFSFYDILDENLSVPPDSIYGGFDIVFCRNVLIFFEPEYQKIIFDKLYKSLNKNGYLILGEAEVPALEFKHKFRRENRCCKIYRKIG